MTILLFGAEFPKKAATEKNEIFKFFSVFGHQWPFPAISLQTRPIFDNIFQFSIRISALRPPEVGLNSNFWFFAYFPSFMYFGLQGQNPELPPREGERRELPPRQGELAGITSQAGGTAEKLPPQVPGITSQT